MSRQPLQTVRKQPRRGKLVGAVMVLVALGVYGSAQAAATSSADPSPPYDDYEQEQLCVNGLHYSLSTAAKAKVNSAEVLRFRFFINRVQPQDRDGNAIPGIDCQRFGTIAGKVYARAPRRPIQAPNKYEQASTVKRFPSIKDGVNIAGKVKMKKWWKPTVHIHNVGNLPTDTLTTLDYSYTSLAHPELNARGKLLFETDTTHAQ